MNFNIWEYVKFLAGIVAIAFLAVLLFEIIATFIRNRRRQSFEDKVLDEAQSAFRDEISSQISKEIAKVFEKNKKQ